MSDLHVVFGTGPAGSWTARALAEKGLRVRAVNRTGLRPEFIPAEVEVVAITDASDPAQATKAAQGASVIYQALNPPYHQWPELFPGLQAGVVAAAKSAGARYVSLENLYMHGPVTGPMNEETPLRPNTRKGTVRANMIAELQKLERAGELEITHGRAADYYGPGVRYSALGERTIPKVIAGKGAEIAVTGDVLHSYAFIKDVGLGLATLGTNDAAFGQAWMLPHAPARTAKETLVPAFRAAGTTPKYAIASPGMMKFFGLFNSGAKETVEMLYEFAEPFVVDSSKFEQAFGIKATSIEQGMRETVEWYAAQK